MRPSAEVLDLTAGRQVLVVSEVDVPRSSERRESQADTRSHSSIVSPPINRPRHRTCETRRNATRRTVFDRLASLTVTDTRLPPPGTVVRRTTARVLPVRPDGKVLLLHGWDPLQARDAVLVHHRRRRSRPARRWRRPVAGSCARRSASNSRPPILGEPVATNTIEFEWGGCPIIQHQTFFAVDVGRRRGELRQPGGSSNWRRSAPTAGGTPTSWRRPGRPRTSPSPVCCGRPSTAITGRLRH